MDIELYDPPVAPPRVPRRSVVAALEDARLPSPVRVHRTVARAVARGSDATARLRLERLARVVMSTDSRVTDPAAVWSADWSQLTPAALEAIDAGVRAAWPGSAATRNAMRDSVRAVLRSCLETGVLSHDEATPRLNAVRPEREDQDEERQARGHLSNSRVRSVFRDLAADGSLTARRDAALLALLVGAGLRREEAVSLDLADLDAAHESLVVRGKGGRVRDVPLAPGARRAVNAWLDHRGCEPGPLLTPMTRTKPRRPVIDRRLSANTVAQVVARRVGPDVRPHDLRRTFTGDLLDSGADLSVVSKVLGHASSTTTAGYDRRGRAARRAAVDKLEVPFEGPEETG